MSFTLPIIIINVINININVIISIILNTTISVTAHRTLYLHLGERNLGNVLGGALHEAISGRERLAVGALLLGDACAANAAAGRADRCVKVRLLRHRTHCSARRPPLADTHFVNHHRCV